MDREEIVQAFRFAGGLILKGIANKLVHDWMQMEPAEMNAAIRDFVPGIPLESLEVLDEAIRLQLRGYFFFPNKYQRIMLIHRLLHQYWGREIQKTNSQH